MQNRSAFPNKKQEQTSARARSHLGGGFLEGGDVVHGPLDELRRFGGVVPPQRVHVDHQPHRRGRAALLVARAVPHAAQLARHVLALVETNKIHTDGRREMEYVCVNHRLPSQAKRPCPSRLAAAKRKRAADHGGPCTKHKQRSSHSARCLLPRGSRGPVKVCRRGRAATGPSPWMIIC